MRRFIALILLSIVHCPLSIILALTIPTGTLYFDNSKTGYNKVCFVYGSDANAWTTVQPMTESTGNVWTVAVNGNQTNVYRFTFVGGDLTAGTFNQTFSTFKDSVSHQLNLNRTATSELQMNDGDIFVPSSGDNWAQGTWTPYWQWLQEQSYTPSASPSGTLPVIYVNTQNGQTINDTETQIPATVYIDSVLAEYPSLGTPTAPLPATIKGRGNWTWRGFDKKPYKIKFDTKTKVLGMPNNRHWCLMANTDDYLGFLKMPAGFRISKALGLRWTPRVRPVEFVLNGKYMGLYFLTEHVRIAGHRVDIKEQVDNETHPDSITGGWLVEIDNYSSENNITLQEGNGQWIMISLREPEVLSTKQRTYLENQMHAINDALYANTDPLPASSISSLIDIDEAAKYYLVQEIMEDCESYHGSCFLYKDRDSLGVADKWKFGPVWDFGNAYDRHQETWIYDNPTFPQYWIGQLATWPEFQQAVKEQWWIYYHTLNDSVRTKIQAFAASITQAAKNDKVVWKDSQGYRDNSNMSSRLSDFLSRYDWRINWLYSQWGEGIKPATWDVDLVESQESRVESKKILRNGQILIERNNHLYPLSGQLVE